MLRMIGKTTLTPIQLGGDHVHARCTNLFMQLIQPSPTFDIGADVYMNYPQISRNRVS